MELKVIHKFLSVSKGDKVYHYGDTFKVNKQSAASLIERGIAEEVKITQVIQEEPNGSSN